MTNLRGFVIILVTQSTGIEPKADGLEIFGFVSSLFVLLDKFLEFAIIKLGGAEMKTLLFFVLALCIAGFIGYHLGSEHTTGQWIEATNKAIPITIDYAIERYAETQSSLQSYRELIKAESMLLFVTQVGFDIEGEKFLEHALK